MADIAPESPADFTGMRSLRPAFDQGEQLWRFREEHMLRIINGLDRIAEAVPAIAVRLDRERIAVAGHSWGGQTASTLLGAPLPIPMTYRW